MSHPVYGRYQVAEPLSNLELLHRPDAKPAALKPVLHTPQLGVLDQSDLDKQGIDTRQLVPGAPQAKALGSCTANANMAAVSNLLSMAQLAHLFDELTGQPYTTADPYADTVMAEKAAICFYHLCTAQTGDPSTEWPPIDCGSSGLYVVDEDKHLGVATGQRIAHDAHSLCSLLQTDGVLMGSPWFFKWEQPDKNGFVDGNGTPADFQAAMDSGVAGGHETYLFGIEQIQFTPSGTIDTLNTIIVDRNSWSPTWGDAGCCRFHLSTLMMLRSYIDWRQIVA